MSVSNGGARHFGIPSSEDWASVTPVEKGWSRDRKYRVRTRDGRQLLLRITDGERYADKRKEFEIVRKFVQTGVPMSEPVAFGTCDGGDVYMLLSWVEGRDLERVLPTLPEAEQYRLGREAGAILRRFHALPVEAEDLPARSKREKKLAQLERYERSSLRVPGDGAAIRFVRENIDRIWRMPPVYQHGDFHPGNLIHRAGGDIGVIDFNRWEAGDPWEEFYKLQSFGRELSVSYCVGQIDAYFDGAVPEDFWRAQAVYVAHAALFSIKWAEQFGQPEIDGMVRRYRIAMADYDGFRRIVPAWYVAPTEVLA